MFAEQNLWAAYQYKAHADCVAEHRQCKNKICHGKHWFLKHVMVHNQHHIHSMFAILHAFFVPCFGSSFTCQDLWEERERFKHPACTSKHHHHGLKLQLMQKSGLIEATSSWIQSFLRLDLVLRASFALLVSFAWVWEPINGVNTTSDEQHMT